MSENKMPAAPTEPAAVGRLTFAEFVLLIAAIMAITPLSIDPMLPALPAIGKDLAIAHVNDRQFIILFFMVGLAGGSLIYGPLSDRLGRRNILLGAIAAMMAATFVCATAQSFAVLCGARLVAGFCSAACRVVAVGIVRDCFRGDRMASVMSLIFVIFMIVPALAPGFGQLILLFAPWRWIFGSLTLVMAVLWFWLLLRLPETLDRENRVEISVSDLWSTLIHILSHRSSMGYMLASGVVMGGLMGFIVSVQQIFFDIFHAPKIFPFAFAGMAIWMGAGSFFNSRLVERIGARRLSQSALIAMILVAAIHFAVSGSGNESMASFMVFQSLTMLCFAFAGSNFSSISMEPFARGAGFAASVQASLTTLISVSLGAVIGQNFDGTTRPLALGFVGFGVIALGIIFWAERGRLFTRPNAPL